MTSEGSHDTEDRSDDAENSALPSQYILKYIKIKKYILNLILNLNNISQYWSVDILLK